MVFKCEFCERVFQRRYDVNRHQKICVKNPNKSEGYKCAKCSKTYTRLEYLRAHQSKHHNEVQKKRCECCDIDITNWNAHLRSNKHRSNTCSSDLVQEITTSFQTRLSSYRIKSAKEFILPEMFLDDIRDSALNCLISKLKQFHNLKINFELFALYGKKGKDEEWITDIKSFNTKNKVIAEHSDLKNTYKEFADEIRTKSEEFQERDSGWTIAKVLYLEVNINKYSPLKGSSYTPLPKWIQNKKACINVKNDDNACFAWSLVSALFPALRDSDRLSSYPHYKHVLKLDKVTFPITVRDIPKIEKMNDVSINVFQIEGKLITGPLYHTSKKQNKHVNLLYLEDGNKEHFCWIKNMSRLVGKQTSEHDHKIWFCDGCLLHFGNEQKLREHTDRGDCAQVVTTLPTPENNILRFKNFRNQLFAPVVIYADFECFLKPITPYSSNNSTTDLHLHEPFSFGYYIKHHHNEELSKYITYSGENCAKKFMELIEEDVRSIIHYYDDVKPMLPLTYEENEKFMKAKNCFICEKELGDDRVRDHCHITQLFRGAAHNSCNINYKIKREIPIVIHNLSRYDAHFIVKVFGSGDVNLIPKNKEVFIGFTKEIKSLNITLKFIDSFRFLPSSLDQLSRNLEDDSFHCVKRFYRDEDSFELIKRKGVFPYEYVDGFEKLEETALPEKQFFYNTLSKSHIDDASFTHAQKVWSYFNCKTIGDYSDLYLKTDVLLLTDVFENFRNICVNTHKLDPAHYYSAPGLSWDAMLKYTKVEIELLSDLSMIKFFQLGVRGGLCQCSQKYAKANNVYMSKYDEEKEQSQIIYLDANNQYGWAMSQYLPIRGFRWLDSMEIAQFNIEEIPKESEHGYVLEVDLDYPYHLHDLHNDLPFCPENIIPEIASSKTTKLIANLHNKEKYIIHYRNLQQAIRNGLIIKKIHRILTFEQSQFLAPYIDLNTKLRQGAKNSFEKDFYKLLNNAVFGKTMENIDKRVDVKLVNSWENQGKRLGARALISRLNFHSATSIAEDITIIQMNRIKVFYNKPIFIGFTVLELSKTLMYDFHYDYMKNNYRSQMSLLYLDTDSFIYELREGRNHYQEVLKDLERFDTSDYSPNNRFGVPLVNKKVPGKFKDECSGVIIKEFIGIRAKCYYISKDDDCEVKKIKGVKRKVVEDEISAENYLQCLRENREIYRNMNIIRSRRHVVYTQQIHKLALNNKDDKIFLIPNTYETLAWGHKNIDSYYFI